MSAQDYLAESLGADITPDMPDLAAMTPEMGGLSSGMAGAGPMPDGGPPPTSIDGGFGMESDPDAPPTNVSMPPPMSEGGAPIEEVIYADGTSWVAPSAGDAELGF